MDRSMHETKIHGRLDFPYIVYKGTIPCTLHNYPLHWHEEFEIIYIEEGEGIISVQSHRYNCGAGDIIIIPPELIHDIRQKENKSMLYFNILFKFSLLEENEKSVCYEKYFQPYRTGSAPKEFYFPPDNALNKKIAPHIQELIARRKDKYTTDELMIKSHLYAVLFELSTRLVPQEARKKNTYASFSRLKPVLAFVQNNFQNELSVKQAAELSNLSESHFMKSFKNLTGMPLIQYVNSVRLEHAERLLQTTGRTVSEICAECGFRSESYFIRTFKKKYGRTPGELQKNGRTS